MGKPSRDKGMRAEREIVHLHVDMGIHAERVPLSGAAGGRFSGDVDIYVHGPNQAPLVGEVKARKNGAGFATLERWMGENDILFLRRDRAEPMVVLPWATWVQILGKGELGMTPAYTMRLSGGRVVHAVQLWYTSISSGTNYWADSQFYNKQRIVCRPWGWKSKGRGYTVFEKKDNEPVTCKACLAQMMK